MRKYLLFISFLLSTLCFSNENLVFARMEKNHVSDITSIVLRKAYSKLNIDISFKEYPPRRALDMSNKGILDGEGYRIKGIDKDFSNLIIVPVPIILIDEVVFTTKNDMEIKGWNSLRPYKIGIISGVVFTEKNTRGMKRVEVDNVVSLLKNISANNIDLGVYAKISGMLLLKKLNIDNINVIIPPVMQIKLYHYLNKKHAYLVPKITAVLKEMQQNGEIEKIRQDYIEKHLGLK